MFLQIGFEWISRFPHQPLNEVTWDRREYVNILECSDILYRCQCKCSTGDPHWRLREVHEWISRFPHQPLNEFPGIRRIWCLRYVNILCWVQKPWHVCTDVVCVNVQYQNQDGIKLLENKRGSQVEQALTLKTSVWIKELQKCTCSIEVSLIRIYRFDVCEFRLKFTCTP